jgi:cobalt/nickel transport system permease protein
VATLRDRAKGTGRGGDGDSEVERGPVPRRPAGEGAYHPSPITHRSRSRSDFVARTIAGVTAALEQAVFSEESARRPGLLQGIDARAKVVAALLLLVTAGFLRNLEPLLALSLLALVAAGLSRLSIAGFARRAWLGIPLFAGVIALPSLFLLPGQPVLLLLDSPPLRLAVSDNGLHSALMLVARVAASVSIAVLLISTTRWTDLLRALSVLRVPQSFLMVLSMTYRYLFQFLRSANDLFLARASRTVGVSSGAEQRRWAGGATGALVSRSVKLSGDVLLAMRARGFDGEVRVAGGRSMRDADWLLLSLTTALATALLLLDRGLA